MGPVQGHQCPYDAPSVAEHFRKTGTVNLNPADVLLFRDSLSILRGSNPEKGRGIHLLVLIASLLTRSIPPLRRHVSTRLDEIKNFHYYLHAGIVADP